VLFPGQGAQFVGMGAGLFDRHPDLLGSDAEAVLGWSPADACLEGPLERLTDTEIAQPALFAVSLATFREFDDALPDGIAVRAAAGHSLGEYTALVAAGALDPTAGLRLVAARGRAMAAAAAREPSGMAALIGADETTAEAFAAARRALGGRLWVANVNAPGQVVVAGGAADLEWAAATARDHGIRRVIPLEVAGAFHTPFMAPAADELAAALDRTPFATPAFPVWANRTAEPHEGDLSGALAAQLTGRVRFADSLRAMASHVDLLVHVGPGDVTAGMARRTVPDLPVEVVDGLEAVEAVVGRLGEAA
jgi:[acyl-carrier-protein] S-malonyltransferase